MARVICCVIVVYWNDAFWQTAGYYIVVIFLNKQEGDGDFSQISSEENELDDELPSNMVSVCFFMINWYLLLLFSDLTLSTGWQEGYPQVPA